MQPHPSDTYIRTKAKIYGRDPSKKITNYQQKINDAAVKLALNDPNLLLCRQKLLELSRTKVNERGYHFKKRKSRSKQLQSDCLPQKRPKSSENLRMKHVKELEEEIKDLSDQEKRRDQAAPSRNYKVCDQLTEEMATVKKWKRECEEELHLWNKRQQQANWYKQKSTNASAKSSTHSSDACDNDSRQWHSSTPYSPSSSLSSTPLPSTPQSFRGNTPHRSVSLSSTPVSPVLDNGIVDLMNLPSEVSTLPSLLPLSPPVTANLSTEAVQRFRQSLSHGGDLPSQDSTPPSPLPLLPPVTTNLSTEAVQCLGQSLFHVGDLPCEDSTLLSPLPFPPPVTANLCTEAVQRLRQSLSLGGDLPCEDSTLLSPLPFPPPVTANLSTEAFQHLRQSLSHGGDLPSEDSTLPYRFPVSQNHIFCKASQVKLGTGGGGGGCLELRGRPESELLALYSKRTCQYHKVSDSIYVSDVELLLSDYIKGRQLYCSERHKTPRFKCESMLRVAQVVHTAGYCSLPHAFKIVSPGVKYMAEKARRLLLQMPLVSIHIGNPDKGNSFSIVIEHCRGVDYSKLSLVLDGLLNSCANQTHKALKRGVLKCYLTWQHLVVNEKL